MNPILLVGLETDFQGSGEKGSAYSTRAAGFTTNAVPFAPAVLTDNENLQWFGTARARIGWTPTPRALVYATGGLAYSGIASNETFRAGIFGPVSNNFNTVRAGWTVGGGVEAFVAKELDGEG